MVRCESSMMDVCLATKRTEIHGGIVGWDTQSEVPFASLLLSDNLRLQTL
jgi:hypothetical protein